MKLAVIGAGNMGGSIITGLLNSEQIRAEEIMIVTPRSRRFEDRGVSIFRSIAESPMATADTIIIAVKPWIATEVVQELGRCIGEKRIVIQSIVAGLTLQELRVILPTQPLIRIMPNTAVRVGQGMTFISSQGANDSEIQQAIEMYQTLGKTMPIQEQQMNAAMSLASCGIAFALRYIRAATEGGVELGIKAEESQQIVAQTLRGAAALLEKEGSHPEVEIDKVTTPGGITIKGLNAMEEHGFTNAVIQGIIASGK